MSTITGFLIRVDGTAEAVEVTQAPEGHLASMRSIIDCNYVDVIGVEGAYGLVDSWVDDEGALTSIPNVAATVIVSELAGRSVPPIFGHALLLSRDGADTVGLSAEQLEDVQSLHAIAQTMPRLHEAINRAHAEAVLSGRL